MSFDEMKTEALRLAHGGAVHSEAAENVVKRAEVYLLFLLSSAPYKKPAQ